MLPPAVLGLAVLLISGLPGCLPSQREGTPSVPQVAEAPRTEPNGGSNPAALERGMQEFPVPERTRPHDVAPATDGGVWYTAQGSGELGHLDPKTGTIRHVGLGSGSAPHGVIVGPDQAPWITDGGLNAIVRVDPANDSVRRFPLPETAAGANLNTATFDSRGTLWFTGQSGVYGRLDRGTGKVDVFPAPKGSGPYGICTAPDGTVWYSSLAGSYIARIDTITGAAEVFDVPTPGGGARRVWSDSSGRLWVTEWFAGKLARFDPATRGWKEWTLPGDRPQPYAVFVDDRDVVWITDFGANAIVRFDPATETFQPVPLAAPDAAVRQLLGRPGEVWGAESGAARIVVTRTR